MENQDSGITVLILAFKQGAFISRAISNLKAQIFQRWKLTMINDSSVAYTAQIVRNLLFDNRIVSVQNESNKGVGNYLNQNLAATVFPPVAHLPAVGGLGDNWQQPLQKIRADIIYALLNYQAVLLETPVMGGAS